MQPNPTKSEPASVFRRAAVVLFWFLAGFAAFVGAVWLAMQLGR